MGEKAHIFDLTRDELRDWADQRGWPLYHADQVLEWVYEKKTIDPQKMTDLSRKDRDMIAENFRFISNRLIDHQVSTDGVHKLLVQWRDGKTSSKINDPRKQTECVMIPAGGSDGAAGMLGGGEGDSDGGKDSDKGRNADSEGSKPRRTACISSQVGCAVGCKFCASGLGGLDGNLSAGRIVEQVWLLNKLLKKKRISNVVFMGMGEPLANFDQVVRAIRTITADWGFNISARKVTVSTVGLPAQIRRLAKIDLPITLAISLHAPNDEIRRELIPWAEYVSIEQLIEAGIYYYERTRREITLEYILLGGVNDQVFHARELAVAAKRLRSNVNLICYNEVGGLPYKRPNDIDVHRFLGALRRAGVNAHIRASRGRDIAAACGQLRHDSAGQSISATSVEE